MAVLVSARLGKMASPLSQATGSLSRVGVRPGAAFVVVYACWSVSLRVSAGVSVSTDFSGTAFGARVQV